MELKEYEKLKDFTNRATPYLERVEVNDLDDQHEVNELLAACYVINQVPVKERQYRTAITEPRGPEVSDGSEGSSGGRDDKAEQPAEGGEKEEVSND